MIIDEADFARALASADFRAPDPRSRGQAIALAALLNTQRNKNIVGARYMEVSLDRTPFLVAQHLAKELTDEITLSDTYAVAVEGLKGKTRGWVFELHRQRDNEHDRTSAGNIACSPIPGRSNSPTVLLPQDFFTSKSAVEFNAERATLFRSGGSSIELRIYPNKAEAASVVRLDCTVVAQNAGQTGLPTAGTARWSLPNTAAIIDERAYLKYGKSNLDGDGVDINSASVAKAAEVAAVANHPAALGIEGVVARASNELHPRVAIVARDLQIDGTRIRASEFYLAPWPKSTPVGAIIGRDLFIDFGNLLPTINIQPPRCGPVAIPTRDPVCLGGLCETLPGWNATQAGYGIDRFANNQNRATLHWPVSGTDLGGAIAVIACSFNEPPPPSDPPLRCDVDVFTGRLILEECNGVDDNCNGQIDEGVACAVPQMCPCQPHSCGTQTCGSIPDGCGSIVVCGAPCP